MVRSPGCARWRRPSRCPPTDLRSRNGHFWWIALASIVVFGLLLLRTGIWTATGAYAAVFWCFHFGLIAVLGSGLVEATDLSIWDQWWVLGPFAADAALVALLGFAAFVSGASLVNASADSTHLQHQAADTPERTHPYGAAGSVLVFGAVAVWVGLVISTTGLTGFFGSYGDYLHATDDFGSPMGLMWLALGCGIVLCVTGRTGWLRSSAIAAFGSAALMALPIGLRGEIMFPTIAALVGAARCGWVLSPGKACAFVAALLVVIPAVREIRGTGLQGVGDMSIELRMFDAFVEMGGSLHPVEKVVRWRAEGEAFEMGGSYWAPIERAAARVLPGARTVAAEDDMRIMNILVTDRVGPIGFHRLPRHTGILGRRRAARPRSARRSPGGNRRHRQPRAGRSGDRHTITLPAADQRAELVRVGPAAMWSGRSVRARPSHRASRGGLDQVHTVCAFYLRIRSQI